MRIRICVFVACLSTMLLIACGKHTDVVNGQNNTDQQENVSGNGNHPGDNNGSQGSDDPGTGSSDAGFSLNRDDIIGTWGIVQAKFDASATMTDWELEDTYFTFKENGLFSCEGYFGDAEGTYSVVENMITAKLDNQPFIVFEVTSLKDEELEITATLASNQLKIWMICRKSAFIDTQPSQPVTEDDFFTSESMLQTYIAGIYNSLIPFIEKKSAIEKICVDGRFDLIMPASQDILSAWAYAYKVLNMTNLAYQHLREKDVDNKEDYLSHLRVIRGYIAYNLTTLWGDVPYTSEPLNVEDVLPVKTQAYILDAAIKDLSVRPDYKFGSSPDYQFMNTTVSVILRAEAYLTLGNEQPALEVLDYVMPAEMIFQYYMNDTWIPLYTSAYFDLLKLEASGSVDDLPEKWQQASMRTGYWQMLKRIGKAQEETGCQDYQLLLPIPQAELDRNPNLCQNPGY